MATDQVVPNPREARRQEWPWAEAIGIKDDGTSWSADGTITRVEYRELGSPHPPGRGRWLQLDGNRFVIFVDDDTEHPTGIWYSPISLLREHIVSAVERERAAIASGTAYPMKSVVVVNIGGRKLARRAWPWRMREGGAVETDWIDPDYLEWETYVATSWPRTPEPRVPVAMDAAA